MSPGDEFDRDHLTEGWVATKLGYTPKSMATYRSEKNWRKIPSGWVKLGKTWYLPVKEWRRWLATKQAHKVA